MLLYIYRLKTDNWDNFGLNFFILKHSSNPYGIQHSLTQRAERRMKEEIREGR
jgi:hypothetical protein